MQRVRAVQRVLQKESGKRAPLCSSSSSSAAFHLATTRPLISSPAAPAARSFSSSSVNMNMLSDPSTKYKPFPDVNLPNRTWPDKRITKAPRWLSSDLRDGNQSNVNPMTIEQKTRFYNQLVACGFKEIEVAFPSASETDFNFVRSLIEKKLGEKEGVWLQVLTQSREDLIRRTFEAVKDAPKVIFHMYNATSPLFRETVFRNSKEQTVELAVKHIKLVRQLVNEARARGDKTEWQLEYSPETFSQTEPEFAVEVCNAVQDAWLEGVDASKEYPIIFNLPATVEVATPNNYADQIEYFCRHVNNRENVVVSLHTHNDRGTGVAATELGLMAGADRVEGCLFGNGERTGNVDLVTVALNMYTQGVSPNLDFSDIYPVIETVTSCNELPVPHRHPYSGELVFTAFSGSHQDAIKKGFAVRNKALANKDENTKWGIPYLPIDPADIGCTYEAVIRVNSQSGKGGVAYLVHQGLQLDLPRRLQVAFYQIVQEVADRSGKELTAEDIQRGFQAAYFYGKGFEGRYRLVDYALDSSSATEADGAKKRTFKGKITVDGKPQEITGQGNGPISSLLDAIAKDCGIALKVREYTEHAIGSGSDTKAASYVELVPDNDDPKAPGIWGVGVDVDVTAASLKAVLSATSGAARSFDDVVDSVESIVKGGNPQSNIEQSAGP